jgi:hypothetical protein
LPDELAAERRNNASHGREPVELDSFRNSSPSGAAQDAWTLFRPSGTESFLVLIPRAYARG